MSLKSRFLASCVAALAITASAQAIAADYDPPIFIEEAPEWVPVEIGSGWYLRGDVSYAFKKNHRDSQISVERSLFNEYLGVGTIGPIDFYSVEENRWPVTGSAGVGYRFSDYVRGDINIGYLGKESYAGPAHLRAGYLQPYRAIDAMDPAFLVPPEIGCSGSREVTESVQAVDGAGNPVGPAQVNTVNNADWRMDCMVYGTAERSSWNGMANGYVDLGTIAGFTPYVGAGIGVLYTSTRLHGAGDCQNRRREEIVTTPSEVKTIEVDFACRGGEGRREAGSSSKTDYNLMYSLSAGVAYQVAENTKLDFGYQYLSAPNVHHYALTDNGFELRRGVSEHQIKVGLRYELW